MSSLEDFRRRTICYDLLETGRCSKRACGFNHHLADPIKLLWFAGELDKKDVHDALRAQSDRDDDVYFTLDFTCISGDAKSGKWRAKTRPVTTFRLGPDYTVTHSTSIQKETSSLLGVLWQLEYLIRDMSSLPGGQSWTPEKSRITVCKKFEESKAHDHCHDRHDLVDFKEIENRLLHFGDSVPGDKAQPARKKFIRITYSLSSEAGFVWGITDEIKHQAVVTESHDLAAAVEALKEYISQNRPALLSPKAPSPPTNDFKIKDNPPSYSSLFDKDGSPFRPSSNVVPPPHADPATSTHTNTTKSTTPSPNQARRKTRVANDHTRPINNRARPSKAPAKQNLAKNSTEHNRHPTTPTTPFNQSERRATVEPLATSTTVSSDKHDAVSLSSHRAPPRPDALFLASNSPDASARTSPLAGSLSGHKSLPHGSPEAASSCSQPVDTGTPPMINKSNCTDIPIPVVPHRRPDATPQRDKCVNPPMIYTDSDGGRSRRDISAIAQPAGAAAVSSRVHSPQLPEHTPEPRGIEHMDPSPEHGFEDWLNSHHRQNDPSSLRDFMIRPDGESLDGRQNIGAVRVRLFDESEGGSALREQCYRLWLDRNLLGDTDENFREWLRDPWSKQKLANSNDSGGPNSSDDFGDNEAVSWAMLGIVGLVVWKCGRWFLRD